MTARKKALVCVALLALAVPAGASGAKVAPHYNGCPIVRKAANVATQDLRDIGIQRYGYTTAKEFRVQWRCGFGGGLAFGMLTVLNTGAPRVSFGVLEMYVCKFGGAVTMKLFPPTPGSDPLIDDWASPLVPGSPSLEKTMIQGLPYYVYLGPC